MSLERMNRRLAQVHFNGIYSELNSVTGYDLLVQELLGRLSNQHGIKQTTIDMIKEVAQGVRDRRHVRRITAEVKSKCFTCAKELGEKYIESVDYANTVYCGEDCFVRMGISKGHTSHVGYSMPSAVRRHVKEMTWFDEPETREKRKICELLGIDFIPDLTTPTSLTTILVRLAEMGACIDLSYRPPEETEGGWFSDVEGLLLDGEIYNISSWAVDKKVSPSPSEALLKSMTELIRFKELPIELISLKESSTEETDTDTILLECSICSNTTTDQCLIDKRVIEGKIVCCPKCGVGQFLEKKERV